MAFRAKEYKRQLSFNPTQISLIILESALSIERVSQASEYLLIEASFELVSTLYDLLSDAMAPQGTKRAGSCKKRSQACSLNLSLKRVIDRRRVLRLYVCV